MLEVWQLCQSSLKSFEFFFEIVQERSIIYIKSYIKVSEFKFWDLSGMDDGPDPQLFNSTRAWLEARSFTYKYTYTNILTFRIQNLLMTFIQWIKSGLIVNIGVFSWMSKVFKFIEALFPQQISWLQVYGNFEKHAQCGKREARLWLPDAHTQAAIHLTNSSKEGCIASVKETSLILKSKQWSRGFLHFQSLASCNVIQC